MNEDSMKCTTGAMSNKSTNERRRGPRSNCITTADKSVNDRRHASIFIDFPCLYRLTLPTLYLNARFLDLRGFRTPVTPLPYHPSQVNKRVCRPRTCVGESQRWLGNYRRKLSFHQDTSFWQYCEDSWWSGVRILLEARPSKALVLGSWPPITPSVSTAIK